MTDQPRLAWLGGKQYPQSGSSRKNQSGFKREHTEAIVENASRTLAAEVEKALTPEPIEESTGGQDAQN